MARATARVVLWQTVGRSGAGPSGMAVAKKKATLKQREKRIPAPLFVPPRNKLGKIYYSLQYPFSLDSFQAEKVRRKIVMDRWMKN